MIHGYRRPTGAFGARNHLLVLPSVVCSGLTAQRIAGDEAVAIPHQHGCAVVGDDVEHTAGVFSGVATNPNVEGVLVVGLGCETIQGAALARRIAGAGQRVAYLSIQAEGGTDRTVARGRDELAALRAATDNAEREPTTVADLTLGLDTADAPLGGELRELARQSGSRLLVSEHVHGPAAHSELAAAGAQVIVAWCGPGEAPRSFAVCPVISISGDPELFAALSDDFDIDGTGSAADVASAVWELALRVFDGQLTAAESRGDADFYLRRLARSM
jgi:altronate dehydratase